MYQLDADEIELIENYRTANNEHKRLILVTSRKAAILAKKKDESRVKL